MPLTHNPHLQNQNTSDRTSPQGRIPNGASTASRVFCTNRLDNYGPPLPAEDMVCVLHHQCPGQFDDGRIIRGVLDGLKPPASFSDP